jgi:glycosyltransferase involved in cell wall biosynthesis
VTEVLLPKISVITVSYNAATTIGRTLQSVQRQDYPSIEHIVVDGLSVDGTQEVIQNNSQRIAVYMSEKDKGMYDAINKGIWLATGDVVGILNADDFFASDTIVSQIADAFMKNEAIDAVIGDISFINQSGAPVRYYSAQNWHAGRFVWGVMPPHPSFYCRRHWFARLGGYRLDFAIAADYELLIRYLAIHKLQFAYLPLHMVKMGLGGKSTRNLRSTLVINQEIKKACKINGLYTNYLMLYSKYFYKVREILHPAGIHEPKHT